LRESHDSHSSAGKKEVAHPGSQKRQWKANNSASVTDESPKPQPPAYAKPAEEKKQTTATFGGQAQQAQK